MDTPELGDGTALVSVCLSARRPGRLLSAPADCSASLTSRIEKRGSGTIRIAGRLQCVCGGVLLLIHTYTVENHRREGARLPLAAEGEGERNRGPG